MSRYNLIYMIYHCQIYSYIYILIHVKNETSAIYVMLYIMLTHNEVPKGFNSEDADRLRLGICFNLLRGVIT